MSGNGSQRELLKAAYAEGVKAALEEYGWDNDSAVAESEKIAQSRFDYDPELNLNVNVGSPMATRSTEYRPAETAQRKSFLSRLLPSSAMGATLGLLGTTGIMAARNPAWRKQFMDVVRRKKDGGVIQALKELSGDTAGIQQYALPGAIGGGAVGLLGTE